MRTIAMLVLWLCLDWAASVRAADPEVDAVVAAAVKAAGGEANLLKVFRIKEELVMGASPDGKKLNRISIIEPPQHWWMNKRDRVVQVKEPAAKLVWAWTLGALVDPKSKLERLPDVEEAGTKWTVVRLTETIEPPMDLYFDSGDGRLGRIDWRSDIHRLSEWRESAGTMYPSRCVGYKKSSGKPWYYSQIVELERLTEVPASVK